MRHLKFTPSLVEFFEKKGKYLTSNEYAREVDKPMTGQAIRRIYGSYARMLKTIHTYRQKQLKAVPVQDKAAELAAKLAQAKKASEELNED